MKNFTLIKLQQLEDRCVPIVGSLNVADAKIVNRGGQYDGVVRIDSATPGTGSLLYTARHVLTAAHVAGGAAAPVMFQLKRGMSNYDISIPVPASGNSTNFTTTHPTYGTITKHRGGYDVSVVKLTDPVLVSPDRHMVAPFGAQRYDLYSGGNEYGSNFTMVGYGREGKGETGSVFTPFNGRPKREGENTFDVDAKVYRNEIQSIELPNATGGTFTLTFAGATTGPIAFNANAGTIQQELEVAKDGAMMTPLAGKIHVRGGATSKQHLLRGVYGLDTRD